MELSARMQYQGRLRSSSSALCALSSLVPPSPILTASELSVTWTSADIPILFESGSITSLCPSEITGSPDASHEIAILQSVDTVDTMCTFGPVNNSFKLHSARGHRDRQSSQARDSGTSMAQSPHYDTGIFGDLLPTRIPTYVASVSDNIEVDPFSEVDDRIYTTHPSSTTNGPPHNAADDYECEEDGTCGQILTYMLPSQTFSTLPTPSFAQPSPSPSLDLTFPCPVSPCSKTTPLLNAEYLVPHQQHRHGQSGIPGEPFRTHGPANFDRISRHGVLQGSGQTCAHLFGADRPPPTFSMCSQLVSDQKDAFLPENLYWLKDFAVGLLIDQEGFRSVQPSFKLMGYYSHFREWNDHLQIPADGYTEEDGVVGFMPTKRESFNFHYTPFDSLPTLRRITVNGNGSKDYISRQASLSLKYNGVYVVRGTETPCSSGYGNITSHSSEPPKLKWKFEYMVGDRRADSTGQIIDGEKTLTPLTFSCSPVLLHSQQGKKVGLMQVVLKSVIPNLTAERMELPKLPLRTGPSMSNLKATIQNTTSHYFAKSHVWTKHRRARSNVSPLEDKEAPIKPSPSKLTTRNHNLQGSVKSSDERSKQQSRRRRASSAGERTRKIPMVSIENVIPVPPRHIIPPAKLCELLSMDAENIVQTVPLQRRVL